MKLVGVTLTIFVFPFGYGGAKSMSLGNRVQRVLGPEERDQKYVTRSEI